jgi:hypothetical protein
MDRATQAGCPISFFNGDVQKSVGVISISDKLSLSLFLAVINKDY